MVECLNFMFATILADSVSDYQLILDNILGREYAIRGANGDLSMTWKSVVWRSICCMINWQKVQSVSCLLLLMTLNKTSKKQVWWKKCFRFKEANRCSCAPSRKHISIYSLAFNCNFTAVFLKLSTRKSDREERQPPNHSDAVTKSILIYTSSLDLFRQSTVGEVVRREQ